MKFYTRLKTLILDPARNFRERLFILLTLVAVMIAGIALLGDILYGENIVEIITLIATVIIVPLLTYIGLKCDRTRYAARTIAFSNSLFIMPVIFFFGGGMQGGAIPWLVFSYLYIGLVLAGRWRASALLVHTLVVSISFTLGYLHPELVHPHSERLFYFDALGGVLEVGLACVIMTWFQSFLYMQENERVKGETRKVEDLYRSQNRFFSSMSHEFRTPINSILGLNEIIIRQEDASEEIVRDARNIQGAGRMLLALINDILDFSKIEAGRMDIVPVNYSVASMVSDIVNMIWLRADQKGLDLIVEVDPSIPSELFGDEVRIKQILINLLNNAVKYTTEGSVTLHIEKEDIRDDRVLLMFSVIDTGAGIKQDSLPYLFDAFRRVDEENNTGIEGTGLGLSIVKQLVELMDGKVTVNSVYTQGSTFMVTLWQKIARFDPVGEIRVTGAGGSVREERYHAGFTAPDARILIVDDNEMNLEVEKKLLRETRIAVDTVSGGEEALSMTGYVRYDLILMDHLMPGMDGITCMQQIRKREDSLNAHVPIVVLTANAGSENRELYGNSGFDGYLVKPVTGLQLEECILNHLPVSKVNRTEEAQKDVHRLITAGSYIRKIPVLIVTNTAAELPAEVLEAHGIDVIPFNIHLGDKVYHDSMETNTEELIRYAAAGMQMYADAPAVSEFEVFFGRALKKAHNIIYITASAAISPEYDKAVSAAKAYGNVLVYDSGASSASIGLMALFANKLSSQGRSPERIIVELDHMKKRLHSSFMTDGSYFAQSRSRRDTGIYNLMQLFSVRPIIGIHGGRYRMERIVMGEQKRCYEKYIDQALPVYVQPDPDLLIVVYVGLTDGQKEFIRERIAKRCAFRSVVFLKACGAFAMNCGPGSVGLVYSEAGDQEYHLSSMFRILEDEDTGTKPGEPDDTAGSAQPAPPRDPERIPVEEKKWYETIPGINGRQGIEYSGSEEAYRELLQIFCGSVGQKQAEIEGYYTAEDWENYTIKVHALKSSARLAGAEQLAKEAQALEDAGNAADIAYIRSHHAGVMSGLAELAGRLSPLFAQDAGGTSTEDVTAAKHRIDLSDAFDRELIGCLYEVLRNGASEKDGAVIEEALHEIGEYELPPEMAEFITDIREKYAAEDYDGIRSLIDGRDAL